MKPPTPLPGWLSKLDLSEPYVTSALQTLSARESWRAAARNSSKEPPSTREPAASQPQTLTGVFSRLNAERKSRSHSGRPRQEIPREHINHYSVAIAVSPENAFKNRYSNVEPYDRTRVVVNDDPATSASPESSGTHGLYLNASWVLERFGHKWWIATQAPLAQTAHAFLSLLMQPVVTPPPSLLKDSNTPPTTQTSRPRTVVQLTQNIESGRRKADGYFPTLVGQSLLVHPESDCRLPMLKITLLSTEHFPDAHCLRSTLSMTAVESRSSDDAPGDIEPIGEPVVFHHMLYESWPDHGVPRPKDRESLLAFIKLVDETNRDLSLCQTHPSPSPHHVCDILDPDPPMLVGCSAGIGRTGSFIALSSLLRDIGVLQPAAHPTPASVLPPAPMGPLPNQFKDDLIVQEVDSLREQRPGMVQRPEQTMLIYDVVMEATQG